jgi:EmrB/QacA subfamily drug resistance transporter
VGSTTGQLGATEQPRPPSVDLATGDEPRPGRRLIFFIVSIALIMTSVDQTIVSTALPSIQDELHTQLNWSSWTITVYALGQIIAMPVVGVISQQFGRKRVFLVCLSVFTMTSLLCGLSTNIYELIALRGVQALGGGGLMPTASGIVADQYGRSRDRALGLFSSIFPIGSAVGPILGGIFVTYWSWRAIFLVNVPIGLIVALLTMRFVPSNAPTGQRSLDVRGIALFGGLILSAMFGVTSLGSGHTSVLDPEFIGFELLAVVLGVAFLRHIGRAEHPFVRPRLLYGQGFAVINSINFLYGAGALGFGALVPVYAEDRYGIRSLSAGTLLTARAIAMMVFAGLAVLMLRRLGYRLPMIAGFVIMAAGLLIIALDPVGLSPYGWLALGAGITGAGMGIAQPAANNAMMQMEPTEVAAVAGLRGMIRQSGSISAVAVTSAIAARSANPGLAISHAFFVFAVLVALTIPLIRYVPEHRGRW